MMSGDKMKLDDLAAPFPAEDVEWRIQSSGEKNGKVWARVLAYVTNRAIMQRLDDVCGPANWRNEFQPGQSGVLCGISIRCGDEWVTKWDGAEKTEIESFKGGLSGAMKRAAVQWGIGRYLYSLESGWATIHDHGSHSAKTKDGKWFRWDPPNLPGWALPGGKAAPRSAKPQAAPPAASPPADNGDARTITEKQAKYLYVLVGKKAANPDETKEAILAKAGIKDFRELPYDHGKALIDKFADMPDREAGNKAPSEGQGDVLSEEELDEIPF